MDQPVSLAVIAALQRGNKIEAIKLLRQERGIGLKEAKDAVEQYVKADPVLQSRMAAAQADAMRVFLRWIVLLLIALTVISYYLFGTR